VRALNWRGLSVIASGPAPSDRFLTCRMSGQGERSSLIIVTPRWGLSPCDAWCNVCVARSRVRACRSDSRLRSRPEPKGRWPYRTLYTDDKPVARSRSSNRGAALLECVRSTIRKTRTRSLLPNSQRHQPCNRHYNTDWPRLGWLDDASHISRFCPGFRTAQPSRIYGFLKGVHDGSQVELGSATQAQMRPYYGSHNYIRHKTDTV
jgi:hypothetical protein